MSAVQFNLLPDVKLEFNRAQRAKRVVYLLSTLAVSISLALFIISLLSVTVLQKKLLSDANNDINKYSQQLKGIPNLEEVLTIQNQLNSLPNLHQKKHVTSRLFTYLPQLTPPNVHIGKLTLDTAANSLNIDGTADKVETINQYVDTLKFTKFLTNNDQATKKIAFSSVILSKVDRNDKNATYTIDAVFDPVLFDASQTVTLAVPQTITTRSVINAPDINNLLFNGETSKPVNQQGGQ